MKNTRRLAHGAATLASPALAQGLAGPHGPDRVGVIAPSPTAAMTFFTVVMECTALCPLGPFYRRSRSRI